MSDQKNSLSTEDLIKMLSKQGLVIKDAKAEEKALHALEVATSEVQSLNNWIERMKQDYVDEKAKVAELEAKVAESNEQAESAVAQSLKSIMMLGDEMQKPGFKSAAWDKEK